MGWTDDTVENPTGPWLIVGGSRHGELLKEDPGDVPGYCFTLLRPTATAQKVAVWAEPSFITHVDVREFRAQYRDAVGKSEMLQGGDGHEED